MDAPQRSASLLERATPQLLAIVAATVIAASVHWQNDGLWFQGDAPRHAANGFFYWDLLTAMPSDPLAYSLSYYARYPVITPVAYPPLFYLIEGAAFWVLGPSPYVAKVLVLSFSVIAGVYTMAWARRWIGPIAGWAGFCTVLLPGFIRFSNAVMLNVPATALGLASLYHFRVWQDTSQPKQLWLFCGLTSAALLTYYPAAVMLPVAVVWMLGSSSRSRSKVLWGLSACVLVAGLLIAIALPVYLDRHAPSIFRLFGVDRWVLFTRRILGLTGVAWLVLGAMGLLVGFLVRRLRGEQVQLAAAFATITAGVVALRWIDPRYALALAPLTVLAAFLGLVRGAAFLGRREPWALNAGAIGFIALSVSLLLTTSVPKVSGFEKVARYVAEQAPNQSVLYSGRYDGVFGVYLRAYDPYFERRLVLWRKFFVGTSRRPEDLSPAAMMTLLQKEAACQWVAVEIFPGRLITYPDKPLRDALAGPEFELVQSFPVTADAVIRVDLYRLTLPVDAPPPVALTFPGFSGRTFNDVEPIPSRR